MAGARRGSWAFLLGVFTATSACGGSDGAGGPGQPEPTDVPVGLTVHCARAFDAGSLPTDGTWVDVTADEGDCLLYQFDTHAGASYAVQALLALGAIDLIVSSRSDFMDLVTASLAFGSQPESATFEAAEPSYWLAVIGKEPRSRASLRLMEAIATPSA